MRKTVTFLLFLLLIIIVLMLSSCSVRINNTIPKYQQRDIAARNFEKKQLPRPKEWAVWSVGLFMFSSIVINTKK